jgi:uncharacterized protein
MRLISTLFVVIALSTFAIPAHAQNSISVNGEAEVRVVPDEVILTLGVETFDKVLKVSKKLNDDRIAKTIAAAKSHGIAPEHIQTDYIGIEPRYQNYEVYNTLLGYVVRKTVVIRLRDLSKFEELLTDAIDAGVTHVHGVEFRTTELRKYRDEARKLALKAAREKAELLAGEAGRTVGKALSIGESSFGYWSSYGSWWGRSGPGAMQNVVQNMGGASVSTDNTLAPGQIAIRATVNTNFVLD